MRGTARVIARNLERTGLGGQARVVTRDVNAWLDDPGGAAADGPYDLVLVDPPYEDIAVLHAALERIGPHLAGGGQVVAKHFWRDAPPARIGLLASARVRRFGETALTFYRHAEA